MEDLTGLGKALESEVAKRAYSDALEKPLRETSETVTEVLQGLRLFTVPFKLAAIARERILAYVDNVRQSVPPEQQQEAAPEIAGPVLEAIRFVGDDNPLMELYLNLLRRAIDKERANEAHPAFPKIIEQLSPDEAKILFLVRYQCYSIERRYVKIGNFQSESVDIKGFPTHELMFSNRVLMYFNHLESLNLLRRMSIDAAESYFLTDFGQVFASACIPDEWPAEKRSDSAK